MLSFIINSESMRRVLLEPQLLSGAGLESQQNEKTRTGRHKGRLHRELLHQVMPGV